MAITRKLSTSLSLPSELNSPPEEFTSYCSMVYGRKQWGKSTFTSQYPNSITFMFEPGRKGLRILQVAPESYEDACKYVELFIEDDKLRHVNLDTVDRFYDQHLIETCMSLSKGERKHPSQFGQEGYAIWDVVKTSFEEIFESIIAAGKTFSIVSHDKKVQQKDRDGQEWVRVEPTCKPAAWKIGQSMCDFVFHCDFLNGDRIITVRDLDNSTLASCNPEIDCFLDPQGEPVRRFLIPNDKSKVFQTVQAAFDNKVQDYSWTPPKKALPAKKTSNTLIKKREPVEA